MLGIEAIVGLILIYLHLQKISGRHQIRTSSLLSNHVINMLLEKKHAKNSLFHYLSLKTMTFKQWQKINSFIVDTNNCLNGIFSSFDPLNSKFSPSFRLIDNFPSSFSFHHAIYKDKKSKEVHLCKHLNRFHFYHCSLRCKY